MQSSVFKKFVQRAIIIVGSFTAASSLTCWANDAYTDFVLLKVGNAEGATSKVSASGVNTELEVSAGQSVTLGYGFQENHLRIVVELNYLDRDAQFASAPSESGSVASTSAYYNVFWVPTFKYNLAAIVGGGVGYSQHKIKDLVAVDNEAVALEDTGWSAKVALGVEYSPLANLGVQLLYENILTDKVNDKKDAPNWTLADLDHSELSLGVLYRF